MERIKHLEIDNDQMRTMTKVRKVTLPYYKTRSVSTKNSTNLDSLEKYETSFLFIDSRSCFENNRQSRFDRNYQFVSKKPSIMKSFL